MVSAELHPDDWETVIHVLDCGGMYELACNIKSQTGVGESGERDEVERPIPPDNVPHPPS